MSGGGVEGQAREGRARGIPLRAELVIITGLSGAGGSTAIHTFEDEGYFCIDNLPPSMIQRVVDLAELPGSRIQRVALVCDVRGKAFFDELVDALSELEKTDSPFKLLFLEADEQVLLSRFKETRRPHPLAESGTSLSESIAAEREMVCELRGRADMVVDTTDLRPQQLRDVIQTEFLGRRREDSLSIHLTSFGFKYGIPPDADIVMDVRFIPNPFYDVDLRPLSGQDGPVRDFVLGQAATETFLERWLAMLGDLAPEYLAEGKSYLGIALGCTGGMHRSVVLVDETARFLEARGYQVAVTHRDLGKDEERR